MPEKPFPSNSSQDEFEDLSTIEASMATFAMSNFDSEHGLILKDWSAQDFANIYVRFRPQLISHARKYLSGEAQAEEIVQDSFLYLMTALPELDSELGVLRFLKWKTKMLCLDLIRASQAGLNSFLVPLPDDVPDVSQSVDVLEQADDAAIIQLALAKLNSRQREALIATMYEEKSHEEVAQQMGIGENAVRQLIFRARASFRQALVGEAEIEGKSVAEILAVAARKAASARTTALVALLAVSTFAVFPMLNNGTQDAEQGEVIVAEPNIPDRPSPQTDGGPEVITEGVPTDAVPSLEAPTSEMENLGPTDSSVDQGEIPQSSRDASDVPFRNDPEAERTTIAREAFKDSLGENLVIAFASQGLSILEQEGQFTAENESGLRASFAVDLDSQSVIQFLVVEFESDGQVWKAVPKRSLSITDQVDGMTSVSYAATDFLVGDFSGNYDYVSTTESVFSRSGIKLDIVFDRDGAILSSQVEFLPKT